MPDHLSGDPVLLVGCGKMGRAHAEVLRALDRPVVACGRGAETAQAFAEQLGVAPGTGPLVSQLAALDRVPAEAVVAVDVGALAQVSELLLRHGVRRLLVEKPAALDLGQLRALQTSADQRGARVAVAYNRRFYASVQRAREIIAEDGGAVSVKFDFTEATARIAGMDRDAVEKRNWFYANSTHVVDLAFHLAGAWPAWLDGLVTGTLPWHPAGAVFAGHGMTTNGAAISYHADWLAPGRWGVEVMTRQRRLVLQPLEQLDVQSWDGFALAPERLGDEPDRTFKPGLYRQLQAFLAEDWDGAVKTLADQVSAWTWYARILEARPARSAESIAS